MMTLAWHDAGLSDTGPPISTSLTRNETLELQKLAEGRDVLEIGAGYGYSAIAMAMTAESVYSIDPHNRILGSGPKMLENMVAYGVANRITVDSNASQHSCPLLYWKGRQFDLIFVDGDHEPMSVLHDLVWAQILRRYNGLIAVHDYQETGQPGVTTALDLLFPLGSKKIVDTLFIV